jgi:hypothetical protein
MERRIIRFTELLISNSYYDPLSEIDENMELLVRLLEEKYDCSDLSYDTRNFTTIRDFLTNRR